MINYKDSAIFNKLILADGIPKEFLPDLGDNDFMFGENNVENIIIRRPERLAKSTESSDKELSARKHDGKLEWPLSCWICRRPIMKKRTFLICNDVCKRSYHIKCHEFMKNHYRNMYDKLVASKKCSGYNDQYELQHIFTEMESSGSGSCSDGENGPGQNNQTAPNHVDNTYKRKKQIPRYLKDNPNALRKCFFCSIFHIGCNGCRKFFPHKDLVKCCIEECSTFYCYPNCFSNTRVIIPDKKIIDLNMSMCGHLHNLIDQNGRPKFICHAHTCWSCYDSDRYIYFWETYWRGEQVKEKASQLISAWNVLKATCRGKVESSHFAKGKKIAKPQKFPELKSFKSFIQSRPYSLTKKSDELYNSSDDDEEYFAKGPSNTLVRCIRCDRTWCTHCVHPDVHILPRSGKQIICHDCIHIQVGCTLSQGSKDSDNRVNIMGKECVYPTINLETQIPSEIYTQLMNFITEHSNYEKKLNLDPSFISKQPAQDSDDDNQILDRHKASILKAKSRKTKRPEPRSYKHNRAKETMEFSPSSGYSEELYLRPFHDMRCREWNMIVKGCDESILSKISTEFRYITANVVSSENRKMIAGPETNTRCSCIKKCGSDCQNVLKNVECTSKNCAMHDYNCGNKRFANFLLPKLKLIYVEGKGIGAVATEDMKENELVCEYVGEVITHSDFQRSLASSSFAEIDDDNQCHWYVMKVHKDIYIDSTHLGNVSRFINHSCDPNCQSVPINVRGTYRMGVFALRKINKGEEVTYNYGFTSKGVGGGFRCRCNAKNCRGIIGAQFAHSPESLMNIEGSKNIGAEVDVLSQLTTDMASLNTANKMQSLKQQPSPLDILNGIWTSGDLHRYDIIMAKLQCTLNNKSFFSKPNAGSKSAKNPLYRLLEDNLHVSEAQFNYVKMLTINSMSMLEFDLANTKQFATNIPWAIVAMGHKDISYTVSMESSTGFFEFYPLAKRFIQISSMVTAGHKYGKAACENIQDLMDLTWGANEPCSACGGYGDCRWCDSCGNVLHDDHTCGDFHVNKEGQNLCTMCQNTDHRYKWYVSSNMDRERMAMELWTMRMKMKMDKQYDMFNKVSNNQKPSKNNKRVLNTDTVETADKDYSKVYIDENRLICTSEEYELFKRDQKSYYRKQMEASEYCYEALTKYECYT